VNGAGGGDFLESSELFSGEVAGDMDRDVCGAWCGVVVVVDVDGDLVELPVFLSSVDDEGGRDAGCECGGEEFV
jgi:hypothetical protein